MIFNRKKIDLGLCTSSGRINSSIVLAGDPKQLDAVTRSKNAIKLGFKTSFMEHLFNRPLYQRNPETGNYNPKYITQLVKNYRSHSAILHIPNMLFYENKLEAKAPAGLNCKNTSRMEKFIESCLSFFPRHYRLVHWLRNVANKNISNHFQVCWWLLQTVT